MTDPATIERLAREAGLYQDGDSWYSIGPGKYDEADVSSVDLARFAALIEAHERERIAAHFDSRDKGVGGFYDPHEPAQIIRALKEPS